MITNLLSGVALQVAACGHELHCPVWQAEIALANSGSGDDCVGKVALRRLPNIRRAEHNDQQRSTAAPITQVIQSDIGAALARVKLDGCAFCLSKKARLGKDEPYKAGLPRLHECKRGSGWGAVVKW